jgi:hypothetical protein
MRINFWVKQVGRNAGRNALDTVGRWRVTDGLASGGVGFMMISKRHLFKSTFELEMHLMLQRTLITY